MEAVKHWKEYQEVLNFMRQDGVIENSRVNERVYAGDQWFHVSKTNELPRIIVNFYKRSCNFLVSAIMNGEVKLNYTVEPYMDDDEEQKEYYEEAEDLFNRYSETQFEQLKQNFLNEQMIKDSLLSGLGLIHYYWDDNVESGNGVTIKGEVKAEIIDAVNFFPADPTLCSVQEQSKIHITYRDSVSNIKAEAKANGLEQPKIDMIVPDHDTQDQGFEKAQREVQGSEKATVLLTYYRKDGKVHFEKSTRTVTFKEETNTNHTYYPIIYMNGEIRKRSIYGTSPFTEIVPNQIYVNTLYSMAMVSTQRTAYPTALYDRTRISGISNAVGRAIGVDGPIQNALSYSSVGQISFDVYNLVDNVLSKTKESVGANDALLGNVKPENTSALLVNQQQANIPLETVRRRFYNAMEDAGIILCEFWKNNYVIDRPVRVKNPKGDDEIVTFNGEKYKDIRMFTKIDVGAASQWSEIVSINTLNEWLARGYIEFTELLERFPKNLVPKLQELLDTRNAKKKAERDQIIRMLPEQTRAYVESLDEMEQEKAVMEIQATMGGGQGEMQPMQAGTPNIQL